MSEAATDFLSGQVAIVTGGANGLGRAVSLRFAAAGAAVAVLSRSEDRIADTVAQIEDAGGRGLAVPADVSDPAAVERSVALVLEKLGPVDVLVNSAGISGPIAPLWEADPTEWWRAVEVNLRGAALCCSAVLHGMVERKQGRIVNVTSNAGVHRWPYLSAYASSKAAVIKLTENLAAEAKKRRVKLFAIDPGMSRVGMTQALLAADEGPDSPVTLVAQWFRSELESGKEVTVEQGADLIATLVSGRADDLSGRYISIYEDLEALIEQGPSIKRGDLYTLRLQEPG